MMPLALADFLKSQRVAVLSTCANALPWSAAVFYAFDEQKNALIFASNAASKHIELASSYKLSANIYKDSSDIASIKGVQMLCLRGFASARQKALYIKTFGKLAGFSAFSAAFGSKIYEAKIEYAKFRDNKKGERLEFGSLDALGQV